MRVFIYDPKSPVVLQFDVDIYTKKISNKTNFHNTTRFKKSFDLNSLRKPVLIEQRTTEELDKNDIDNSKLMAKHMGYKFMLITIDKDKKRISPIKIKKRKKPDYGRITKKNCSDAKKLLKKVKTLDDFIKLF